MLRLRLDEGGGETLKNSSPQAQPASIATSNGTPQWGETTWLWPDFRMNTSTRVILGQTGDYEWKQAFSSGGWFMLRSAPNFTVNGTSGALISKMDTKRHDRGWDLSIDKGIVRVDQVNRQPKEDPSANPPEAKNAAHKDDAFRYPTPTHLSAKHRAPNYVHKKKDDRHTTHT